MIISINKYNLCLRFCAAVNEVAIVERPSDRRVHIRYEPSIGEQTTQGGHDGMDGQFTVEYDVDRQHDGGDLLVSVTLFNLCKFSQNKK